MPHVKITPKIVQEKNIDLNLATPSHKDMITAIGKALSSPVRIDILNLIKLRPMSLQEIAETLHLPISSTAMHIKSLENAHLIITENQPGIRGSMRVCICGFLSFHLEAYDSETDSKMPPYFWICLWETTPHFPLSQLVALPEWTAS